MHLNLVGKSAFITGSSRGIGFAIAQMLSSEGCRITLNGRDASSLTKAIDRLPGSIGVVDDVSKYAGAQHAIEEVLKFRGEIDILVCNVGSGRSVPPGAETVDEWQRVFAQNLWSTTNIVEAARDALSKSKGVVVCISSICGLEVIPGAPVTYSAAKAALHAYVRGIARPLGKQGVRINAIALGNILFDGSVWSKKLTEASQEVKSLLVNDVTLERLGNLNDVVNLVAYLTSPCSSFVTGSIWNLDGGQVHA